MDLNGPRMMSDLIWSKMKGKIKLWIVGVGVDILEDM